MGERGWEVIGYWDTRTSVKTLFISPLLLIIDLTYLWRRF
jgi:hypothetical protein